MPWTLVAANRGRGGAVINSTGANFLIASIRYYGSSSGFGNGQTSSANVWTLVGTTMDRGGQKMDTYVCDAPAYVGPVTSVQGSLTYFTCTIAAFVRPAGALTVGTPASATAASVSSLASGSLTPAADDALLVSWVSFNNDVGEATRPSGWQVGSSIASVTGDGYGGAMSWLNQTTAAAVNPSWSVPTATDMLVRAVAFTVAGTPSGPTFTTQPSNQTVTAPNTASFSAVYTGTIAGHQWQVSTNGGSSWSNVSDGSGQSGGSGTGGTLTYTTTATAVSTGNHRNGYQYRCVLNPSGTPVNSNAATLTVNAPPLAITTDPLRDQNNTLLASTTLTRAYAIRISDHTLVANWAAPITNPSGVLSLSNAALTAAPHLLVTYTATGLLAGAQVYTPA